jgi:hypothetical protein
MIKNKLICLIYIKRFCIYVLSFLRTKILFPTNCKNHSTSSRTNPHRINIRIHTHLPLPIQESLRSLHTDAAASRLR